MALLLGCIADDYTGATDLANTLTRAGLVTLQLQGLPSANVEIPDADAIVVALKIRSVAAADAAQRALDAHDWLAARNAAHIMYKICSTFDSTDAGNIGPVIEALRARHNGALMPVTPAFPATGRTVYKGHLFVGDALLSESPLKDHPLNPMHDANLVRLLGRQMRDSVALADLGVVEAGAESLASRFAALAETHVGAVIIDAVSDAHLTAIGEAVARTPVSTGASGLGLGLARAFSARACARKRAPASHTREGATAIIAGSCSHATLEQLAYARQAMPVLQLDANAIVANPEREIAAALAWATPHVDDQHAFIIATSAPAADVKEVQAKHTIARVAGAVEAALGAIAVELADLGVANIIVAGGETSGAVVDQLGVRAFSIGAEVAPGVPIVYAYGWGRPLSLVLKSGNFGARTFFEDAIKALAA